MTIINKIRIAIAICVIVTASCDTKAKKNDIVIRSATPPVEAKPVSWGEWLDSRFIDAGRKAITIKADQLKTGAPSGTIVSTYAVARLPIGFFASGIRPIDGADYAPMPYLSFRADRDSQVSVRYVKSVGSVNMQSLSVVPRECPASLAGPSERKLAPVQATPDPSAPAPAAGPETVIPTVSLCIPLINQIVPDYLKPTDALGAYVHTFLVSIKKPGAETGYSMVVKLSINILIPDSKISIDASPELAALKMRDRLLIFSNDLAGSPRRDFPAAIISSELPPGVDTKWILKLTDFKMSIEEDVFFEMPIVKGKGRLKPNISRGQSFIRRSVSVDSIKNFRLRLQDSYDPSKFFEVRPNGTTLVEVPIIDPNAPLRLFVLPDFKSDDATMSMTSYLKPYYPVFCNLQAAIFKPEEWRQANLKIGGFVACEALTKSKIASSADQAARNIIRPVETFFGSFSYKAMNGRALGGLSGILSARVLISGLMEAKVVNPLDLTQSIAVGSTKFAFSYTLPSALMDMKDIVSGVNAPPGLDVILDAIPAKGTIDPPNVNGRAPFPFIGEWSDNVVF